MFWLGELRRRFDRTCRPRCDKDPAKFDDAKRYETVSYDDVLAKRLGVMDASAIALARDNNLPIIVFSLDEPGGFRGILAGEGTYTRVQG